MNLRKWTEKDGTPPDGLYISAITRGSVLFALTNGKIHGERECEGCIEDVWLFPGPIYGPIEAEGGADHE